MKFISKNKKIKKFSSIPENFRKKENHKKHGFIKLKVTAELPLLKYTRAPGLLKWLGHERRTRPQHNSLQTASPTSRRRPYLWGYRAGAWNAPASLLLMLLQQPPEVADSQTQTQRQALCFPEAKVLIPPKFFYSTEDARAFIRRGRLLALKLDSYVMADSKRDIWS